MWIDAICIDQDNVLQKGPQVAMMGMLYARAAGVVVWLGPAADESDRAMGLVQSWGSQVSYSVETGHLQPCGGLQAVAAYVVAFLKDANLAGILVSLVPCFFLMTLGGNYFTKKYAGRVSDGATKATAIASESLAHMRLIKVFGAACRIESILIYRPSQGHPRCRRRQSPHRVGADGPLVLYCVLCQRCGYVGRWSADCRVRGDEWW